MRVHPFNLADLVDEVESYYTMRGLTDGSHLDGLECGGAYLKLLKDSKALHAEEFSNASPYVIMFGPDKCGATNKVRCSFFRGTQISNSVNRFTLSSSTRTQRPANMKKSI